MSRRSASIIINVSNYVKPAIELIRQLHSNPTNSGPSILAFITTIVNESGRLYAVTDVITIPVIPGLARGSVVTVDVNFTPQIISQLTISDQPQSTASQDPGPPSTISGSCTWFFPFEVCTEWEETKVIAQSSDAPLPLVITYIGPSNQYPHSASYTYEVDESAEVAISTSTSSYIGFDMSLAVPTSSGEPFIEVPGPGYGWSTSTSSSTMLLNYQCFFHDSLTSNEPSSVCGYGNPTSSTTQQQLPDFGSNGGLMSINIYGTEYILNYTEYECTYYLGIAQLGCEAINYSYSAWFAPSTAGNGQWSAGGYIDTNPTAQSTWLSKLVYALASGNLLKYQPITSTYGPASFYRITSLTLVSSGSSNEYAVGIPAAAICYLMGIDCPPQVDYLTVGIDLSSTSYVNAVYNLVSSTEAPSSNVYFCDPGYYELNENVYIQNLQGYYPVPMMIAEPNPAPFCLSQPIYFIRPINATNTK
ncbi:hypothetical protein [Vulcanisaeta sp. JCM 16159]|uniref:hypothetical protein n=1 Tax=Vulcanisaeta sp. JCM 16159 TaxID=1295371 RepID=UPI0006D14A92|nr:hypothetical protein [Vulcanisaeta sp. JCM 16159]